VQPNAAWSSPTRYSLKRSGGDGSGAEVISSSPTQRGINIFSHQGAPVVAVNDGVIKAMGDSPKLGKYIVLEDAYRNRYVYAELGQIVRDGGGVLSSGTERQPLVDSQNLRPRLYALPDRAPEGSTQGADAESADSNTTLEVGSRVAGGAVIGRVGAAAGGVDPHINFAIVPTGAGAAAIDPKPILDGWKLLEATAIYRANGKNALASGLAIGGVLLLPKEALQQRVLHDKGLSIYECGRQDVASGRIDRRILAMLEYLSSRGFELTITSLECGHGTLTSSGNVSEHSTGDAVDIATIDGVPVAGHQGPGTLTDELIRTVLQLQGTMHPHQVISLEDLPGETSFALPDHYDHVHVGYYPVSGPFDQQFNSLLKPSQWARLTHQLAEIENPEVRTEPSRAAIPDKVGKGKAAKSGGTDGGGSSDPPPFLFLTETPDPGGGAGRRSRSPRC